MDSKENRAVVIGLKGQRCIYKWKVLIYEVRILDARADDWGVHFDFEIITTLGAGGADSRPFSAANGRWDIIGISKNRVSAAYASWTVLFGEGVVDEVVAFAAECNDIIQLVDYVNLYPRKSWRDE